MFRSEETKAGKSGERFAPLFPCSGGYSSTHDHASV